MKITANKFQTDLVQPPDIHTLEDLLNYRSNQLTLSFNLLDFSLKFFGIPSIMLYNCNHDYFTISKQHLLTLWVLAFMLFNSFVGGLT